MSRLTTGLAVFFLALIATFNTAYSSSQNSKTIYFEQVSKELPQEFHNRLADDDYHYILSQKPNVQAIQSQSVTVEKGQFAYIGQLRRLAPIQPRKSVCFNNICVVVQNKPSHRHTKNFNYLEPLSNETYQHTPNPLTSFAPSNIINAASLSQNRLRLLSAAELKHKLSELSGAKSVVLNGQTVRIRERSSQKGRQNTLAYLKKEYEALGYQTRFESFNGRFRSGANFVAERTGRNPNKVFIVSSHIDSVRNAGADDDGSGTITALSIATALKNIPLEYTLRFVGFDLEESGLVGARAYVRNLVNKSQIGNVIGVYHLEMTGYDSDNDGAFHIVDCNENNSRQITDVILSTIESKNMNLRYVRACTNASDHSAFWRQGRPAIVVSQNFFGGDGNPCYHRRCDTVDNINFQYMKKLTDASALSVQRIVQAR